MQPNRVFIAYFIALNFLCFCHKSSAVEIRGVVENPAEKNQIQEWIPGSNPPSFEFLNTRLPKLPPGLELPDALGTCEKAVILVHGWNPDRVANPIAHGAAWRLLSSNLIQHLNATRSSNDWAVINCNWAQFAATGQIYDSNFRAASTAAVNANQIGFDYARALNARCPKLRRVHFMAHSAGSWLARSAINGLLAINPLVVCQLTLLDPFIPSNLSVSAYGVTTLSQNSMEDMGSNGRVWAAENIYSYYDTKKLGKNVSNSSTQGDYSWGRLNDNFRVDPVPENTPYYADHSGPILFYADTIAALPPNSYTHPDLSLVPDGQQHGASRSFWQSEGLFPQIVSEVPSSGKISRSSGQIARLQVNVSQPSDKTFQWWKLNQRSDGKGKIKVSVTGNTITTNSILDLLVTSSMKDEEYVCEIDQSNKRRTFSSVFKVSTDFGGSVTVAPAVSGMLPSLPSADSVGPQLITVAGRDFSASPPSTVTLISPSSVSQTVTPTVISSNELSFNYTFTGQPGPWSLVVKNGSNSSPSLSFRAVSSTASIAPRNLTRISIENLPGTILEGQTASNVRIKAFYSDGTDGLVSSLTSANWNIQYSALSFSPPSTFTAAQVISDTFATVTATYSEGGITKSYQSQITVLNNTSSGGVVTGEIVKNGTLGNNGLYWTTNNADFRITSDYSFGGHTGGYAWMATSAGGQGNNLAGAFFQVIDLPSNASQLTLKFSCAISVQNPSAASANDRVSVILRDENDFNPVNLISVDPVNQPLALGQWVTYSVDLTPYKGTRKKLVFGGSTDFSNPATLRVDDVRVEITAATPTLVDLAITGPDVVKEGTVSSYKAIASDTTGSATEVTTSATWSVNENATISAGNLTAPQVIVQRTARITASYSSGGITKSVSKDVTILDTAPVPVSLAIYGPSQVDETSGGTFSAVMLLSTGVYQEVSNSVYWSFTGTGGQVDPIGRLYTNEVAADTVLTVKAAYEKDGVTVTAETPLTILDRLPPILPSSMVIVGPSSVDEASIGLFDTEVSYADGSKKFVTAFWQENSRFTTISEYGVLASEQVLSDQVVTLNASFTENSVTVNATKNVTIANTLNTIAKPEIIMPASIEVPVDRQLNLRLQTAHPAVSASATGLPSGLTFNGSTFEIQGTPVDVGTWEIQLSATNDFGSSTGILLLTISEDAGPEWIRFTKAEALTIDTIGITSDGQGGCYLYGYNTVSHRNSAGVFDFNIGPMGVQIHDVSGSPNGFAVSGRFDSTFTIGGRTINKFPNGEGEAVVIVFNKAGQALWHDTAHSSYRNVNPGPVVLNPDGSLFWGLNYFASVGFQTLGVGVELLNPSNPGQMDCTVIKINPNYSFGWGHRWGGNQQDEILEITPNSSFACRVKVNSRSSTLTRNELPYVGLYPTQWNKGNSSSDFHLIESVFDRGSYAEAQLDSADSYAYPLDLISDPSADYRFWIAGNFKDSASFKRYQNGVVSENISLPAASNGRMSGFVLKSGFSTQTSSTALFKSLAPSVYGINEVFVRRIAPMSDGSVLSVGTYTSSFDYNGSKFLDSPQDYTQTQPNKRAFIAGHDSTNSMKWVLACSGINGGIPTHLERVGNDKWVMLCSSNGDAKFGRLPVIPGGGLIIVDIERKLPQTENSMTYEAWLSGGLSAGEMASLRAGGISNDLNQNGKPDLLDYAFGATTAFDLPNSDPTCSLVTNPDTTKHLAITFDRALGRSDSKIAVEISDGLASWLTGSVYAIGADTPNTGHTTEVSRVNMGSYERITVADKRPATNTRFMRIKATTGPTPIPSPAP